jgi:hypothetical protein
MAKVKKTPATETGDAASAKKITRVPPRPMRKPPTPPTGGAPLVDTTLAAQNAARTLAARAKLGSAAATPESAEKESGSFKQLKESLNKPAAHVVNNTIGGILGGHKSSLPNTGFGQTFHNQVQGGPKFNVPRRTNG